MWYNRYIECSWKYSDLPTIKLITAIVSFCTAVVVLYVIPTGLKYINYAKDLKVSQVSLEGELKQLKSIFDIIPTKDSATGI